MKKFSVLASAQAVSLFGSSVVGFALAWYLARETHSATILSTAMLANFLPQIVLGPFIGPYVDRWNRKKVMIFGDLATALLTLVLVVLYYTNTIQIWLIYVVMAGRSATGSFQGPAFSASVPMVVTEKQLVRANALNRTLTGSINIIGPASGASLMQALPIQWVLAVDIITAVPFVGCLLLLKIPQPARTTHPAKNVIGDMMQGFRYIASWKGLLFLILFASALNFFLAPLNSLLPLFVTNYLGGDVLSLGWLGTAFGAGVIAGGLVLGVWGRFKRRILTSFMGLVMWCTAIIAFGFTTERRFLAGLAAWLICGLGNSLFNTPLVAILQAAVPKDMQGRFFTTMGSMTAAMLLPSLTLAGPVADAIGVRPIYFISGAAMLTLVVVALFSRDLMHIEDHKTTNEPLMETQPIPGA